VQEVSKLPGALTKQRQVVHQLSSLMNHQLESKAKEVRKELTQKYEQIIEEKSREGEIVRKQFQQTVAEKRQTESVLRSVSEGVVVVDGDGKVIFMNPAAERMMGIKREQKLGKPLKEDLRDEQLVSLVQANSAAEQQDIEISANLDQTRRVLRASNAVVQDENGKTVGMVSVLSDVTKQRELDRLKSEFVSTVTHELRTPIVAMKHSLAVLMDGSAGQITEAQANFLGIANRNLDRLGRLVDDLLDLAKLEAKKITLSYEEASLEEIVGSSIQGVQAWASSKKLKVVREIQPGLPRAEVDPLRVGQVLNNLVSNAIKFTPENGTVTVRVKSGEPGMLQLSVKDTGIGIAREDTNKLFQKFTQLGGGKVAGVSGTGLGLSIAKEIVQLHGGTLWVESEPGHGAEFFFTLPLKAHPTAQAT
jgi:two-component system sensor histidine kinase VicK